MMTAYYPGPTQRPQGAPPLRHLRQVLHPDYAMLPHAELSELMESVYGPDAAERYDDYLDGIFGGIGNAFSSAARDVGRFAVKAAPAIATVGGGVMQGAMAGSSIGLPGIIAGAATGGLGAGLSRYGSGTARDVGKTLSGVTSVVGQFSPTGRLGAALGGSVSSLAGGGGGGKNIGGAAMNALGRMLGGGAGGSVMRSLGGMAGQGGGTPLAALSSLFGGSSAASQLTSLLQRPEVQRALGALQLGPLGRSTVPTGRARTPLPTTAITNLIGQLANQTAAETAAWAGDGERTLHYMTDQFGEYVGDPAVESERAERVWELLNEAQAERVLRRAVHSVREQAEQDEQARVEQAARLRESAEAYDDAYEEEALYDGEALYDSEAFDDADESAPYFDADESEYLL